MLFAEDAVDQGVAALNEVTGGNVASAAGDGDGQPERGGALVFPRIGVAVVDALTAHDASVLRGRGRRDSSRRPEGASRTVEVIVCVATDHLARVHEVVAALDQAGLRDAVVLAATGVVTGQFDGEAATDALAQVPGVDAVEESRVIDIGPPDAPVQ